MNMLRFNELKFLLIFSVLCYLTRPVLSDCLNSFVEGVDYFPDKVSFEDDGQNNSEFIVDYHNSYIIVTNIKTNEAYILYCTKTEPNIPASSVKFIQVPVKNVAVSDRATISFLEILGEERSIKYVANKATITSPCLLKYKDSYETMNFANTTQVDDAGVIFTDKPKRGKSSVTVSIDENATALGKAQWIKFVSLFFNKTAVANDAYNKIRDNYLCHADNVNNIPNKTRKTIAWVSLESANNFTIKYQSFYPDITLKSAAFPLNPMIPSYLMADEIRQEINEAYIVIDMSVLVAPENFDAWKRFFGYDKVTDLPRFLKEKRLYRTRRLLNTMNSDDWTETSPSRPDILLQDLIAIQYPSYQPDYIVTWFDKFAETGDKVDKVYVSEGQCNDNTFGLPKTDFGTCTPMKFIGDGKDNAGNQILDVGNNGKDNGDNGSNNDSGSKANAGVIVAATLIGTLVVFGVGALLFVVLRRRYRRRFVKLRDDVKEPVVQMDSVKEVK